MSKKVGETTVRVRYAKSDPWGIALYLTYFVWFELARMEFLRELGYGFRGWEGRGEFSHRYHAPARFEDLIVVKISIGGCETTVSPSGTKS